MTVNKKNKKGGSVCGSTTGTKTGGGKDKGCMCDKKVGGANKNRKKNKKQKGGDDGCSINTRTGRCSKRGTQNPERCEISGRGRCKKKTVRAQGRGRGRAQGRVQGRSRGRGRGRAHYVCYINARTGRCSKTGTVNPDACKLNPSGRCAKVGRPRAVRARAVVNRRTNSSERRRRQISADARMARNLEGRELAAIHRRNIERQERRRQRARGMSRRQNQSLRPKTKTVKSQKLASVKKKTCRDNYIMFDDLEIEEYLKEDKNNFVIQLGGKFECQNLENLKTQWKYKHPRTRKVKYNVWYECKRADPTRYGRNSIKNNKFIKMGSSNTVVKKPRWWPNGPLTSSRVYKLVKDKKVPALVSSNVLDGMNIVGKDHCNHTSPVQTYKIENIK